MSRDADFVVMQDSIAAAAAGTLNLYFPIPTRFKWEGFAWGYLTAEANTDNTIDFVIAADTEGDGTFDGATLFTNANACGLLDSAAIGEMEINFGNAASGGGAAVAVTPTAVDIAAQSTIRVAITTAGTGTVPAIKFAIFGHWLTPLPTTGVEI